LFHDERNDVRERLISLKLTRRRPNKWSEKIYVLALSAVRKARQRQVGGLIVHELNCLNVGETLAQPDRDDQHDGDETEIPELLSKGRMLSHCGESAPK
jgi:hypothetical protein